MDTVNLTRELLAAGYTNNELARLSKAGNLVHLRRGAYAQPSEQHSEAAARHRQLIQATVPLAAPGSTVSHTSAAVLHGLPVWGDRLERVQLTRTLPSGGKRKGYIHLHAAPLDPTETVHIAGLAVTSLARTMVDLGRSLPFDQAVVAGDAALRAGLDPVDLQAVLCRARRRPGVAAARRAASFLDGLSESPGESLSRVGFAAVGLPAPTLQYDVFDEAGVLVGRSDFCWEEHRTLGEFDGG